jgi:cytochrome c553
MKTNQLAQVALLLWVVTIAVFVWFFIRGSTIAGTDGRTAIVLHPRERELVLTEMRGLLAATQGILEGANQGDMPRIIKAARAAGMAGTADVNPALMAKLPLEFKALGMGVHHEMDEIAKAAEDGKPAAELLKMTSNTLTKCVACHAAWQLKADS